jgi:hypothetical protein
MYAVGSWRYFDEGRFYAIYEVVSAPEPSPHSRWPWMVMAPMVLAGPSLRHCPKITEIDIERRSIRQQSHLSLTAQQGRRAEELVARAAERHGALADVNIIDSGVTRRGPA